jgi:hypothetical protein
MRSFALPQRARPLFNLTPLTTDLVPQVLPGYLRVQTAEGTRG